MCRLTFLLVCWSTVITNPMYCSVMDANICSKCTTPWFSRVIDVVKHKDVVMESGFWRFCSPRRMLHSNWNWQESRQDEWQILHLWGEIAALELWKYAFNYPVSKHTNRRSNTANSLFWDVTYSAEAQCSLECGHLTQD